MPALIVAAACGRISTTDEALPSPANPGGPISAYSDRPAGILECGGQRGRSLTNDSDLGPKTRAFLSYSRKDLDFADRLAEALQARGIEVLIDRTEIVEFEDWWQRLQSLITQAHAVIFVVSSDSVRSDVCRREVAFAEEQHKRLAPIVLERVPDAEVPEQLSRLNYLYFDDPAQFSTSLDRLIEALFTDIQWVRKHTEIGQQALRWAAAGRPGPRGLLLRPPDLEEAERWLATRPPSAPSPSQVHIEFIVESRRSEQKRLHLERRRTRILAAAAVTVAAIVLMLGWSFYGASQEALRLQSLGLADVSRQQLGNDDVVTAQLLALEGLPDSASLDLSGRLRPYAAPAGVALDAATRKWRSAQWREGP